MDCTINPAPACEYSLCDDGQNCLGTIDSPTSQVPNEIENAATDTFEDWMVPSGHSWLGSLVQDSVFENASRGGAYHPLDKCSWDEFETVAVAEGQAVGHPGEIADSTEPPELNFVPSMEEAALDLDLSPSGLMLPFPSTKQMLITKHLQPHEKAEEGHINLELHLEPPAPVDILEKSLDAPRESSRNSRPRRALTRAPKVQKAIKKEPSTTPKTNEVSSRRRRCPPNNSKSQPSQNDKCRLAWSSSNSPTSSAETRTNHNLIEKQYRNRLNIQFESLMGTLPKGFLGEKKAGKAEVLVRANKYIQELEKELKDAEVKNAGLERNIKDLETSYLVMLQQDSCRVARTRKESGMAEMVDVEPCVNNMLLVAKGND